jgi:phosphomannomutase
VVTPGQSKEVLQAAEVVVFDLDDTLAPSKSPMDDRMAEALVRLLDHVQVCIISGGRFEQFQAQVLTRLDGRGGKLDRLHLMPTCGTRYYRRVDDEWALQYTEDLSAAEKAEVARVLEAGARELGLWQETAWGDLIEDRGSQVTYSALGQLAPLAAKAAWDPTGDKKRALRAYVADRLPELEVRGGGSTSIDVTRKGIDKAYGIQKLEAQIDVPSQRHLFIGDRLDETGNDYPVLAMGVRCIAVDRWEETVEIVDRLIEWWDAGQAGLPPELHILPTPQHVAG